MLLEKNVTTIRELILISSHQRWEFIKENKRVRKQEKKKKKLDQVKKSDPDHTFLFSFFLFYLVAILVE